MPACSCVSAQLASEEPGHVTLEVPGHVTWVGRVTCGRAGSRILEGPVHVTEAVCSAQNRSKAPVMVLDYPMKTLMQAAPSIMTVCAPAHTHAPCRPLCREPVPLTPSPTPYPRSPPCRLAHPGPVRPAGPPLAARPMFHQHAYCHAITALPPIPVRSNCHAILLSRHGHAVTPSSVLVAINLTLSVQVPIDLILFEFERCCDATSGGAAAGVALPP